MTLPMVLESDDARKDASGGDVRRGIQAFLERVDLHLAPQGPYRPWGVEVKIAESDTARFVQMFFADTNMAAKAAAAPSGPRILAIRDRGQLSWPVDGRRTSFMRAVRGRIEVRVRPVAPGERIRPSVLYRGACVFVPERAPHRLVSTGDWAILAVVASNVDFSRA